MTTTPTMTSTTALTSVLHQSREPRYRIILLGPKWHIQVRCLWFWVTLVSAKQDEFTSGQMVKSLQCYLQKGYFNHNSIRLHFDEDGNPVE